MDDRLLSLLIMLGPEAVAADPGLPLRLLPDVKKLLPMTSKQRRMLGLRVSFSGATGQSLGADPGAGRGIAGGVEMGRMRVDWRSLLPSQLAIPDNILSYRSPRGELLFHSRVIAEPARLRPTVILLDVSPACFGPVESITRLAAFTVARSLRRAGIPVVLITSGDKSGGGETVRELENTSNLVDIWTQRTMKPPNHARSLKLASAIRSTLRDGGGLEPAIFIMLSILDFQALLDRLDDEEDLRSIREAEAEPLFDQKEAEDYIFMNPVKRERLEKGWSQEELARKLGVKQSSVAKWERDGAVYRERTRLKFAEVFGIGEEAFW